MAIDVQALDQLDQTQVDQAIAFATQLLAEKRPNIDTKRGVISELIIGLDGILNGAQRTNISLERQSHSLAAITANPTLADDSIVNDVLSNYRLSRRSSTYATGEITIIINSQLETVISQGTVFNVGDVQFTADETYTAKISGTAVLENNERLLTQLTADRYAFTINATALVAGSSSSVVKDTAMVPVSTVPNFVQAYAASNFTNGLDAQSNQDLINLLAEGLASRAWSNRLTIPAMIRSADPDAYTTVTTAFANILDMSIVGFGDAEMQRDQHWLFPVSGGGRTDVYLRSQALPNKVEFNKTATVVRKTTDGAIWSLSIDRDDAPGFYEVTKIIIKGADPDTSGYEVTSDTRVLDISGTIYVPDVQTGLEGTYSKYQKATIEFLDTDTSVTDAECGCPDGEAITQEYTVTVSVMPLIKELQEFLGDRQIISPAGDVLVKGVIPCSLSLGFDIQRRNVTTVVDTAGIAKSLAAYVNKLGFASVLYASALARIIDEFLPTGIDAGAIDMFGRIRKPDGTIAYIRSDSVLTITEDKNAFTSGRTVAFMLSADDITINDISVSVPTV